MIDQQESSIYRHLALMMALFFLFSSIYAITYSGRVSYNDELQMFDSTGSLIEFGDSRYDLVTEFVISKLNLPQVDPSLLYPLSDSVIEPGYIVLGTPLYKLAELIPQIGLLHTTWLLNILISAALCTLLFFHVRLLGYDFRVAFIAALLIGFCTILWPYSRTYLREPFLMFLFLLIAHLLERARLAPRCSVGKRLWYLLGAIFCFWVAVNTKKESIVLLFAYIPVFIVPKKRLSIIGIILSIFLLFILAYTDVAAVVLPSSFSLFNYTATTDNFQTAIHSYLFSAGGSIWGTSPILLLTIPGAWILLRREQHRYVWMMIMGMLAFAIGHAFVAGHWFGGATLPPRFLIPIIPFIVVCMLPLIEMFVKGQIPKWGRWLISGLIVYSIWWQLSGVLLSWSSYTDALPPESKGLATWLPSINRIEFLRPFVLTPLWFEEQIDFVWIRTGVYLWPILFFVTGIGSAVFIRVHARLSIRRMLVVAYMVLPILFIGSMMFMLASVYDQDEEYLISKMALGTVSHVLDDVEVDGDILILNDPTYLYYFLNTRIFDKSRVVSLPQHPGERGSFDQMPQVESNEPLNLIAPRVAEVVDSLSVRRDRLWLLMETGPYVPWSVRPMERFLARYYYPIRELPYEPIDPSVRLLEYSTVAAPDVGAEPEILTEFAFGEQLILEGITLPSGLIYKPNDVLPVSFYWNAVDSIDYDYTVAMFLVDGSGIVVQQGQDSAPYAGFSLTSAWTIGDKILDNRAIRLSKDLPSGKYYLWVRLYRRDVEGNLIHLSVGDDTDIAVLPVTITSEQ